MADKIETVNALDKAAAHLIQKAVDGMGSAVSFLSEQIPDVVRQLLIWEMSWSVLMSVLITGLLIVLYKIWHKGWNTIRDDDGLFFMSVGAAGAGCVLIIALIYNIKIALIIAVAPKVFLVRYAADLLK